MTGVPVRTSGKSQATAGYQELVSYERQLLDSRLRELVLDDQTSEEVDDWEIIAPVIREIGQRSTEVGERIVGDRPERTEVPPEVGNCLTSIGIC